MSDLFSLYVPFQFPDGRTIKDLPYTSTLGGNPTELRANAPHLAIEVRGIPSEAEAGRMFAMLTEALHWAALDRGVGIEFPRELADVHRPADPIQAARNIERAVGLRKERIDVVVDGGRPYVKKDTDHTLTETGQPIRALLSNAPEPFIRALDVGLGIVRTAGPISSELRLACEVYSQTHFLPSGFARFQALFIPLEVAAPTDVDAHPVTVLHVSRWKDELNKTIDAAATDDAVREQLVYLRGRLGQLAKESHTGRIQRFVATTLHKAGNVDADRHSDVIVRLYRKRGRLTHAGASDVTQHLAELETIVRSTLSAAWTAR